MSGRMGRPRDRLKVLRPLPLVLGAALIAGLALTVLLARGGSGPAIAGPAAGDGLDAVMEVRVTLSTDDAEPVEVWRDRVSFPVETRPLPTTEASVDLTPWAGRLVRFDIEGEVRLPGTHSSPLGYVGCSAQVADSVGARPIEFIGWHNEGALRQHVGSLGPRSALSHQDGGSAFWYAMEGSLWHVLPAAEASALRLRLRPLLAQELESEPTEPDAARPAAAGRTASVRLGRMPSGPERPPDVFIYLIDALRADHLGCYGYGRETSPNTDAFAAEGVVFENAHTTATWTRPAVASLLSGLYPSFHGVHTASDKLGDWVVLLPEALAASGYRCYSIANNPHTGEECGFNQGYDRFAREMLRSASSVNSDVARILAGEGRDHRVFVYAHTLEPHGPYVPTPSARESFDSGAVGTCDGASWGALAANRIYPWLSDVDVAHLMDLYDAEVFDNDRAFGEFLELLEQAGRLRDSLVILASDHGEAFDEHDTLMHGCTLSREEMQVPLIIRFPHGAYGGLRVEQPVSLVDVFPTVLAQTGTEPGLGYPIPGTDLSRSLRQPDADERRRLYAEVSHPPEYSIDLLAVIDEDRHKSVTEMSPRRITARKALGLWDTRTDPNESVDLSALLPVRVSYHEQLLAHWLAAQTEHRVSAGATPPPTVHMTEEAERGLRALGYLQ